MAELIAKKANPVWKSSLMTTSRVDTEQLIQKEKSFCSLEYFYGKLRIYYTYYFGIQHPVYRWFLAWDMQWDPADYIKMGKDSLKEALSKSPKVLRTIRCNKSPIILNSNYSMKMEPYSKISPEIYKKRMKILDESNDFRECILNILQEKAEEREKAARIQQAQLLDIAIEKVAKAQSEAAKDLKKKKEPKKKKST